MTAGEAAMLFLGIVNTVVVVLTYWKAREVQHATNSMKDELVAVTRSDATQAGITEGRIAQKAETDAANPKGPTP